MNKFKYIDEESYGRIFGDFVPSESTVKALKDFCDKHPDLKLHEDEDGIFWVHTLHEFTHHLRNQ